MTFRYVSGTNQIWSIAKRIAVPKSEDRKYLIVPTNHKKSPIGKTKLPQNFRAAR